jgi:hypothetical protein
MVATIRHNFMEAVMSYEEKPREQWIFDPPAQVSQSCMQGAQGQSRGGCGDRAPSKLLIFINTANCYRRFLTPNTRTVGY